MQEEKLVLELKKRNGTKGEPRGSLEQSLRKVKRKNPMFRILLLLCFCILFSVFFQGGLRRLLENYERAKLVMESEGESLTFIAEDAAESENSVNAGDSAVKSMEGTSTATIGETELISANPEAPLSGEEIREALLRLSTEQESFRKARSSMTMREQEQEIADVWNRIHERLLKRISENLDKEMQEELLESEKRFRRERKTEAMKEVNVGNSGATENVDYLRKYAELTEKRCYELVKRYLMEG